MLHRLKVVSFGSLTKEAVVNDRVVTMQVRFLLEEFYLLHASRF